MSANQNQIDKAVGIVGYYTVVAAATGAIPVPASSAAVIAENSVMVAHIESALGEKISVANVAQSLGVISNINIVCRSLFIEGARLLSWGTGSVWALACLCTLGASTAGLQTYIIGRLAIEIGRNDGTVLPSGVSAQIIANAKDTYTDFFDEWKDKATKTCQVGI